MRQNCPRRANRLLSSKIKFAQVDLRKDWFEAALRRALVHRCKVARSVVHRFRLTRTYPVDIHTLLDMDPRTLGQATIPANVPANVPGNVIVTIGDSELLDQVLSITAVVGVEPLVLGDVGLLLDFGCGTGGCCRSDSTDHDH